MQQWDYAAAAAAGAGGRGATDRTYAPAAADILASEDGIKWHLDAFNNYLERELGEDPRAFEKNVEDVVVQALLSVQTEMRHEYFQCFPRHTSRFVGFQCFQLLGVDILLRDNGPRTGGGPRLQPVLLEVNRMPALHLDGPVDRVSKPEVVRDALVLGAIDAEQLLATASRNPAIAGRPLGALPGG